MRLTRKSVLKIPKSIPGEFLIWVLCDAKNVRAGEAPRQIGPLLSDVLILGFADATGAILLLQPAAAVPDGARLA